MDSPRQTSGTTRKLLISLLEPVFRTTGSTRSSLSRSGEYTVRLSATARPARPVPTGMRRLATASSTSGSDAATYSWPSSTSRIDPALVEDVIMGCVMQTGEQGLNIGRNAALAAGFPESVVGTSVDRQCGSSQQSAHFAAQGVIAGAYDVVVAAGVECMTRVPMGVTMNGPGMPFGPKMMERYQASGGLVPQGISAEMIADKWNLSREDMDAFSVQSHKRAARATEAGRV